MMKLSSSRMMTVALWMMTSGAGTVASTMLRTTPSSTSHWISLEKDVEFQPNDNVAGWTTTTTTLEQQQQQQQQHHHHHRSLRQLWGSRTSTNADHHRFNGIFADGSETLYDSYATAWRFMGFYQDCDVCVGNDNNNNNKNNVEIKSMAECIVNGIMPSCKRYALWAAYVDLDYEGNGPAEYMYYDRTSGRYNDAACKATGGSSSTTTTRCVKMDCHEPNTHYTLLGFFKHIQYGAFLDAIFDYQGDCVWTDNEYKFMMGTTSNDDVDGDGVDGSSSSWPLKGMCSATNTDGVYYDMKPARGGNIDIGLYDDATCSTEYSGSDVTVNDVWALSGATDTGKSGKDQLKAWNEAIDAFKVCQPCMTYDLVSLIHHGKDSSKVVNQNGDRYTTDDGDVAEDDAAAAAAADDAVAAEDGPFVCASADPINQCQVFARNANMVRASYHDVVLAESQSTVTGVNAGVQLGEPPKKIHTWLSIVLLLVGIAFFLFAVHRLYRKDRDGNPDLNEPLVGRNKSTSTEVEGAATPTNGTSTNNRTSKMNMSTSNKDTNTNATSGSTRSIGRAGSNRSIGRAGSNRSIGRTGSN